MGGKTIVMGDLVLTEEEVNPVMAKLLAGGLRVTALHNHLLRNRPFGPSAVARFCLGGTGMIGAETGGLFLLGLPALALGTWAGPNLFGRLKDASFRRVVLVLLLLSGVSLLFRIG
jgi:hypothetical protein